MSRRAVPIWHLVAYLLVFSGALASGGCLLVAAGAAGGAAVGYAYCQGKVCELYAASFNDSWAATHAALADLGMPVLSEERKADGGTIESRTADGDKVHIYFKDLPSSIPAEGQVTRVGVRVATFGDRVLSERILYQVGSHLAPPGAVPPVPAAAPPGAVMQTGATSTAPPPLAAPAHSTPPPPELPSAPVPVGK